MDVVQALKSLGISFMIIEVEGEGQFWVNWWEFDRYSTIDRIPTKSGQDYGEQAFLHDSYWRN